NDVMASVVSPPGAVYALGFARGQWSAVRGKVYLDRPNVLTQHTILRQGEGSQMVACDGFDIVTNDVAVIGTAAGPMPDAPAIRLRQGVADTAAEAALVSGCGKLENTSELFALAADKPESWTLIRDRTDPGLRKLELPAD